MGMANSCPRQIGQKLTDHSLIGKPPSFPKQAHNILSPLQIPLSPFSLSACCSYKLVVLLPTPSINTNTHSTQFNPQFPLLPKFSKKQAKNAFHVPVANVHRVAALLCPASADDRDCQRPVLGRRLGPSMGRRMGTSLGRLGRFGTFHGLPIGNNFSGRWGGWGGPGWGGGWGWRG